MTKRNAKVIIVGIFLIIRQLAFSQVDLSYYMPEIEYDSTISLPEEILSYQPGEWHVTHDQLVNFMYTICAQSDKCQIKEYARSHENRPLVYMTISDPDNLNNIDALKRKHKSLVEGPSVSDKALKDVPIIIYQGYSIHGNESSGSNASMLLAYYLLAGKSEELNQLLKNSIILLDPCYNPDGLQRFSSWANSHKHKNLNPDPNSREFDEVWPKGRTNHYWFDLNRDWIFNIHPESKGRIKVFHEWNPDILTDHHEMGSNSTFFFQPGIPSRTNPNTPQLNQDLTGEIGQYHASFLDSIGSAYYTKESFDDYYYGKGSTYPDINGCVGILFEQASSRGHLRNTRNGVISFPFTIRNQFVTSLSTQKAALELKDKILMYKRDFYNIKKNKDLKGAYVFEAKDEYKKQFFIDLLNRHKIKVFKLSQNVQIEGRKFSSESSFVVPKNQMQYHLAKTVFEKVNQFPDSLFYDVSAWTLPLALNIPFAESKNAVPFDGNKPVVGIEYKSYKLKFDHGHYAILAEWSSYLAPAFLNELLEKNIRVNVMAEGTQVQTDGHNRLFESGTLMIPMWGQDDKSREQVSEIVNKLAQKYQVKLFATNSGLSHDGKSLGSPKAQSIEPLNVAMIVGEGINAYEAGACWYQMDQRFNIPISLLDIHNNPNVSLHRYNVIILPDGNYKGFQKFDDKIKQWTKKGGKLIVMRSAIHYTNTLEMTKAISKKKQSDDETFKSYENHAHDHGSQVIGGAIFESEIDLSHPLFFGYSQKTLPVFKRGTQFYEPTKNSYATPMVYAQSPLMSGYCSEKNQNLAKESAAVMCFGYGSGKIIAMVDNPNFRGYWLGGSHLFANAMFFADIISTSTIQK